MKPIWWLLVIAMGIAFYVLGKLNMQVSNFRVFIFWFFIAVWVSLFVFWISHRRKSGVESLGSHHVDSPASHG